MPNESPSSSATTSVTSKGRRHNERGAVLVQTAIAMIGLIAFNGLVVDYGVLWLARRQAQSAADAGAMAGAIQLAFFDFDDTAAAKTKAISAAEQNWVWGEAPGITVDDVFVPPSE